MLYRHPKSPYLWCRFEFDGREIRRSTKTTDRAQAEAYETRLRNLVWRQVRLGEKPHVLWEAATKRWLAETQKRTKAKDESIIEWFDQHLKGQPISNITREVIDELRALKAEETSESNANRYMAFLRALLKRAADDWKVIDSVPKVQMFKVVLPEPTWITRAQFNKLAKALPPHLRDMATFSVATGLRMRNVTHLAWDRVDLKRRHVWIPGSRAKAGKPIAVPLNADAVEILKRWKGRHALRVFVFRGKPIDDANGAAFKAAVASVGLPGLRWHDLRHTWASWHSMAGTPPQVLQELGAWSSYEMVRRYSHLSSAHLAKWAKKVQSRK